MQETLRGPELRVQRSKVGFARIVDGWEEVATASSLDNLKAHNVWCLWGKATDGAFALPLRQIESMSDLDHAVFKTPVETLVNLWLARFGSGWIPKEEVRNDEFFDWAALRLNKLGKLEEQTVVNTTNIHDFPSRVMVRIVEE